MVRSYRIVGSVGPATVRPATGADATVTTGRRVMPGTIRDASAVFDAQGDEVVRVELDNGFVLWTRVDDLIRDRGRRRAGRDGAEAWEITFQAPPHSGRAAASGQRGWLGLGIRVLDFFGVDIAGKTAAAIGRRFEERALGRAPGLYRCSLDQRFALTPVEAADDGDEPTLLFLHDAGSSCRGSFGKLWTGAAARASLARHYGERVFAWEHRSLTVSPIQNALELVQCLPKGSALHLVGHSRGGLVGELLCLGQRVREDDPLRTDVLQTLFAADRTLAPQLDLDPLDVGAEKARDQAYQADRKALAQLLRELDQRKIKVSRFVRVACPARGTTLASGRLDRWLSVLDFLSGGGIVGDVADFMLAVVKERTDPRVLPGLEAMMPGSALTRLLQHPDLTTRADLSIIAGDIEGDGLWSQVKLVAADWFFGGEHDLVVNTGSMAGGLRRSPGGARYLCDRGANVNHFNYFANDKSVRWLVAGLTRAEDSDGGFLPIEQAKAAEPCWRAAVQRSRTTTEPRPLAVVLPGTMGSTLEVRDKNGVRERVWLDHATLMHGGLSKIRMDAADIEAVDPLDDLYGPLLEFLARSHRIEIFPYDWRLSVRDAADKLAAKLEAWLQEAERTRQPVHLVAHSTGGLVARAMIADDGRGAAVWQRIRALPNSRFMMLGTPNLGCYEAVRWLTGRNATQSKLSLLDLTHDTDQIVDLVREFPGLLELLPFDPDSPDFSRRKLWQELRRALGADWQAAAEGPLREAAATWALLKAAAPDPEMMIYVAGCQNATVAGYRLVDHEWSPQLKRKRLQFLGTHAGDGTVSWKSGFLPGVPVWYVEGSAHDDLCRQKRALPGYLDLLMTGRTSLLPNAPPAGFRGADTGEAFVMPSLPPIDDIPGPQALRGLGLGPATPAGEVEEALPSPVIQVGIVHGDLAYARHPVMVGHYQGDVIVSAEAALDARLGHALSRRHELGLYPGTSGSHAVFFNDKPAGQPAGAIVIGLGQVGSLSPSALHATIGTALVDYALQVAQRPDDRFGAEGTVRSAAVSTLLVGSGPSGISVRDAMEAILRGAVDANTRLAKAGVDNRVLIDKLRFLEIYQDTALAAGKALEDLLADGRLATAVAWTSGVVEEGEGRRRRVRYNDSHGWWQRLEIIEDKEGGLRFVATTDRARSEVTHATGQLRLAESFIRQASRSPAANTEVAKTLFEMLLPNRLKEVAPQQSDTVLLVDTVSARYPWELIEDRWSRSGRPPAVAAGMIRQMKTPVFRDRPAHTTEATAYVVGNPDLGGWRAFPDLPGARAEAQKVAALLAGNGFRVRDCIDGGADELMAGLHRNAWRILHLAGHGEHEFALEAAGGVPAARRVSGMVIGNNVFLTPGDVEQMRWVPELVFINCCHLGKTQDASHGEFSALAANLGTQFINMGVRAVVAAGWAVDDGAANAFAETFYRHLLAGDSFGTAVRAAREDIWVRFPEVNTWGAYQCYGDPGYSLHGGVLSRPWQPSFQAPAELVAELDNQREAARMRMKEEGDTETVVVAMRADIDKLLAAVPEKQQKEWLARGDVAAAAGFAWGETGDYARAIEWLERALRAEHGDCPLRAVEQCANFRVRASGQRWLTLRGRRGKVAANDRQRLIEDIATAIRELDTFCRRAPTAERFDLLGGACRRLAWMTTDPAARLESLVNMADYYRHAVDLDQDGNPYAFANWAVATALMAAMDKTQGDSWRSGVATQCRQMGTLARERGAARPNFWNAVSAADNELARLLVLGDKPDRSAATAIAALYRAAAERGASPRQYASVIEHLDFVVDLAHALSLPAAEAVKDIRTAL